MYLGLWADFVFTVCLLLLACLATCIVWLHDMGAKLKVRLNVRVSVRVRAVWLHEMGGNLKEDRPHLLTLSPSFLLPSMSPAPTLVKTNIGQGQLLLKRCIVRPCLPRNRTAITARHHQGKIGDRSTDPEQPGLEDDRVWAARFALFAMVSLGN